MGPHRILVEAPIKFRMEQQGSATGLAVIIGTTNPHRRGSCEPKRRGQTLIDREDPRLARTSGI